MILEEDTGLEGKHLINAMLNRKKWKEDSSGMTQYNNTIIINDK